MFQHFLITRFNIKLAEWQTTKNGEGVNSEKWLLERFKLFHSYCLPSVKQQTNQNFKWLVCFDFETPQNFKAEIAKIVSSYPNFIPVFFQESENFLIRIKTEVTGLLNPQTTHIITTRLDNDDALHKLFIEKIQEHFKVKDQLIIDVIEGYQLIVPTKKQTLRKMKAPYNPFLSLVESKLNFQTILSKPHLEWHTAPTLTIKNSPLWMQIIHERNISNAEKLFFPETNKCDLKDFGIKENPNLKSDWEVALSRFSDLWKRILIKLKIVSLPY